MAHQYQVIKGNQLYTISTGKPIARIAHVDLAEVAFCAEDETFYNVNSQYAERIAGRDIEQEQALWYLIEIARSNSEQDARAALDRSFRGIDQSVRDEASRKYTVATGVATVRFTDPR